MKTIKLISILFTVSILILMSSCTQDDSFGEQESNNIKTESTKFNILPLNDKGVRNTIYEANYRIEDISSEFDIENDVIQLEIPIPLNDFRFLRAYNVSTEDNVAILYVIQRDEQNVVVNLPINYVVQDEISMSDLGIDKNLLASNGCMRIHVMNNSEEDLLLDQDGILDCFISTLDLYTCGDENANFAGCFNNDRGDYRRPMTGASKEIIK